MGIGQNSRDVLSERAQRVKQFVVWRLDRYDGQEESWEEAIVEDPHTPVFEQVWFRIDFPAWLRRLSPRDRRAAKSLAMGNTTTDVARQLDVSAGRVSQLRRELHKSWLEFHGDREGAVLWPAGFQSAALGRYANIGIDDALAEHLATIVPAAGISLAALAARAGIDPASPLVRMHIFHLLAVGGLSFDPRLRPLGRSNPPLSPRCDLMGPVRIGVGTEWLLDGRAFRVVRQLAADRFIAQDVKFLVEQEFSRDEILTHYSAGRLRFAAKQGTTETRKPRRVRRTVQELEARQKRILEQRWRALEPLTKLGD